MLSGGPFLGTRNLGVAVAMASSYMAASDTSSNGVVNTYKFVNGAWSPFYSVPGQQDVSLFGMSVDWNNANSSLVVGAPGVYALGTQTATGAAYFYELDSTGTAFSQLGSELRGDEDVYAANEFFGNAVAVSSNLVVAVGAPFSNKGNVAERGRVYTFFYSPTISDWAPRQVSWLLGETSGDHLGMAVDLSSDGNVMVAGAPGRNSGAGAIFLYVWSGSDWNLVSLIDASVGGEAFGSSVQVLSSDGQYVAAGGPGFYSDAGIIRVYARSSDQTRLCRGKYNWIGRCNACEACV